MMPTSPSTAPSITPTAVADARGLVLSNGLLDITVLPQCGGKIAQIVDRRAGKAWLWENPHLAHRMPNGRGRYVEEYDNGGWDECFPTIAPGPYPMGALAGRETGNHGVLWELPWTIQEQRADERGSVLAMSIRPKAFPVLIQRRLFLPAGKAWFEARYHMRNLSNERLGFLWAIHPLIPIGDGLSLHFGDAATVRVVMLEGGWKGRAPLDAPMELPQFLRAFDDPSTSGEACAAAKFFTEELPGGWGEVRDTTGNTLRFEIQSASMDGFGVWINRRWWSGCGSAPYANVGFEPVMGACDSLRDSLRNGGRHHWIEGDSEREWQVRVRAGNGARPTLDA